MTTRAILICMATFCVFSAAHAKATGLPEIPATVGSFAADQPELADMRTFLTLAAENNNDLQAAFQQWQAAIGKSEAANVLPDPVLSFGSYTTPLETRGGPALYKYGLTQKFPFFGKLALKEQMALREADGLKAGLVAMKLATFREVKNAYYEYAYLAKAIDTTKENLALMQYFEAIATARYTTGSAQYADVIRPQMELGKLEERLRSLTDQGQPLQARLNALLDRPSQTPIAFPQSLPTMTLVDSRETLLTELLANSPVLASQDAIMAREQAGADMAKREYFPDFTFGVDVTEVGAARTPGVTGDGKNPVVATVAVNIPLWFDARKAAVSEGKAKVLAAQQKRRGLERQLTASLEQALYKYRDAARKIDLYGHTLTPKARQSLEVTVEAFMTGKSSSLELIDAERILLEFQIAYYRAVADQGQSIADIENLVGRELPCVFHDSRLSDKP